MTDSNKILETEARRQSEMMASRSAGNFAIAVGALSFFGLVWAKMSGAMALTWPAVFVLPFAAIAVFYWIEKKRLLRNKKGS